MPSARQCVDLNAVKKIAAGAFERMRTAMVATIKALHIAPTKGQASDPIGGTPRKLGRTY